MGRKIKNGTIQCKFCKKYPDMITPDEDGTARIGYVCDCQKYTRVYDDALEYAENIRLAADGWNDMQRSKAFLDNAGYFLDLEKEEEHG